jgi:hypothetical protein
MKNDKLTSTVRRLVSFRPPGMQPFLTATLVIAVSLWVGCRPLAEEKRRVPKAKDVVAHPAFSTNEPDKVDVWEQQALLIALQEENEVASAIIDAHTSGKLDNAATKGIAERAKSESKRRCDRIELAAAAFHAEVRDGKTVSLPALIAPKRSSYYEALIVSGNSEKLFESWE